MEYGLALDSGDRLSAGGGLAGCAAACGRCLPRLGPTPWCSTASHPYEALLGALGAAPKMHRVWCRRPMSAAGLRPRRAGARALLRRRARARASSPPSSIAVPPWRAASTPMRVAPMVFCEPADLLERDAAERELGLEPGRLNVLVALGQGAEVREATARSLRALGGGPESRSRRSPRRSPSSGSSGRGSSTCARLTR